MHLKKREKKKEVRKVFPFSLYPPGRRQRKEVEEKRMITTTAPGGVPPEGDEPTGHEDESQ